MPENIPSAINNPLLSEDSLFRMNLDTKMRFENMLGNVQTPMAYQIAKSPEVDLFDQPRTPQGFLLEDKNTAGSIGEALFHPDVRVSAYASDFLARSSQKTPTAYGIGVPETFEYNEEMNKYLDGQFGYNPYKSIEENEEFYYQNEWQQKGVINKLASTVTKGLSRFVAGVGLKTIQTMGYMGAGVWNGLQEIFDPSGNNAMMDISNNVLSRWAEDAEKDIKDSSVLAVFKPAGWEDKGFFSKLGEGAFWSDEVSDGAAFMGEMMLTSYLGGAALGRIGWASRLGATAINTASKAGKAGKLLDYGIKALTGASDINGVGRWAFMTTSESAMEASQQFKTKKERLRVARDRGENSYSDAEIDNMAGDAAASAFKDNMAILAISNAFENRFIFEPLFSKARRAQRAVGAVEGGMGDYIRVGRRTGALDEVARASRSKYFGLIDKTSRLGFYGSRALKASAMEGFWEENAQLATERLSAIDDYQNAGFFGRKKDLLLQSGKQAINALPFGKDDDPEAATNIGLGALIGIAGVGGISKVTGGQKAFQGERRSTRATVDTAVDSYEKYRKEFLSFNQIYDEDENGDLIVNEEKAKALLSGIVDFTNKQQMIDAITDPLFKKHVQHRAMINYVAAAQAAGIMDKVISRFQNVESRFTGEQMKELGFDPNTAQDPGSVVNDLIAFAKIYQKHNESEITPPKDLKDKKAIQEFYNDEYKRRGNAYAAEARAYSARQIAAEYQLDYADDEQVVNALSSDPAEHVGMADQYNSLAFQLARIEGAMEREKDHGSDYYTEYLKGEKSRIEEEQKKLLSLINNKISSEVEGVANENAIETPAESQVSKIKFRQTNEGLIVAAEKYEGMTDAEIGIQLNIDKRSQAKNAELTVSANMDDHLTKQLSAPGEKGRENWKKYNEYLDSIKKKDDAADTAQNQTATPASVTPLGQETNNAAPASAENTVENTAAETATNNTPPPAPASTVVDLSTMEPDKLRKYFNDWFLAIKKKDLTEMESRKENIKALSPTTIMQQRNRGAALTSFAPVMDDIDKEIIALVGQDFFDEYIKANPTEKKARYEVGQQVMYDGQAHIVAEVEGTPAKGFSYALEDLDENPVNDEAGAKLFIEEKDVAAYVAPQPTEEEEPEQTNKEKTKTEQIADFFNNISADEGSKAKIRDYADRILAGEPRDKVLEGLGKSFTDPVDALVALESKAEEPTSGVEATPALGGPTIVTEPAVHSEPTEDSLAEKKADIERRRQEELQKRIGKKSEIWKDDEDRYYRLEYTNDGHVRLFPVESDGKPIGGIIGEYSDQVDPKSYIHNAEKISDFELKGKDEFIAKINAKYDAELAALEPQVTETSEQPIDDAIPHHTVESLSVVGAQFPLFNSSQHGFDDGTNIDGLRSHTHEVISVHPSPEGTRIVVKNLQKPGKAFPLGLISEELPSINREIDIINEANREKAENDRKKKEASEKFRLEQEKKQQELKNKPSEPIVEEPKESDAQALLAAAPQRVDDVPPTETGDGPIWTGGFQPVGNNPITSLVDQAREEGEFVFETVNPQEIEMDGPRPRVNEDGTITLKTASDPALLRHHNVMQWLQNEMMKDDEFIRNIKIRLELISPENEEWMYQKDEKRNSLMSVLVDKNGNYLYFDKKGKPSNQEEGVPFGVEYEDMMYNAENLNQSRDMLASSNRIGSSITHGYGKTTAPLMTMMKLIHNKVPIYGSIIGMLNGTLTTYNNRNNYNNMMDGRSYQMRPLKELIDAGIIEDQLTDIRVSGWYLDRPNAMTDQRTKIGRAYAYDVKSGMYIPLVGRSLKDITFEGTAIGKDTVLYRVIDHLDKKGSITVDDVDSDGNPIITDPQMLDDIGGFLRALLWSKTNMISKAPNGGLTLTRNIGREDAPEFVGEPLRPTSLWDTEINWARRLAGNTSINIPVPTSTDEDTGNTYELNYNEFLIENFQTGAAQAVVEPGKPPTFTKVNKRMLIKLDDTHDQMLERISTDVESITESSNDPQVGEVYAPKSDISTRWTVSEIEDDEVTLVNEEGAEKKVNKKGIASKWLKIDKIEKVKPADATDAQKAAIKLVAPLRKAGGFIRPKSTLTVTGLIKPTKIQKEQEGESLEQPKDNKQSPATVMGNVVDHIAKNVFTGKRVTFDEKVVIGKDRIKGTLGSWFTSELAFNNTVQTLSTIRDKMLKDGWHFETDIIVYDSENDVTGEIDLLAISPEGELSIGDFKTSRSNFDESHMNQNWGSEVTEREYFATQGYLYGIMLAKQTGLKVSDTNFILGLPIVYREDKENPIDSKLDSIREKEDYVVRFPKTAIAKHYIKEGTPMSSMNDVVKQYNTLKNQDATPLRGRQKRGGSLLMSVQEVDNIIAASRAELQAEVEQMREMLGGQFVVNFVNAINRTKYGEWNANGVTLWQNAIKGTAFHEGWHQFSQLFLTEDDKIKMYDSLIKQNIQYKDRAGNNRTTAEDSHLGVEEFLADEWVKYVQARNNGTRYTFPGKSNGIIGFFKNLWNFLKNWFSGTKDPNTLFKDLYNGNLSKYNPDINNAIWGDLNSTILDNNNQEIINHTRMNLYIRTTSYMIGDIIRKTGLSFTWLRSNVKSGDLKNLVYDEYVELENRIVAKLGAQDYEEVLADPKAMIEKAVSQGNTTRELAAKWVGQNQEINRILGNENEAFERFYNYYIANSDVDVIRESGDKSTGVESVFDDPSIKEQLNDFLSSLDEFTSSQASGEGEDEDGDDETDDENQMIHGKGPNEESAYAKASKEIQDFFRTMPVVVAINQDGTLEYALNELDIPETYDYSSVFNKTKGLLAGKFTIEAILERLSNPDLLIDFPQARFIHDQLVGYQKLPKPENFSFIQRFIKVMALPEVDNRKVTINFDNVQSDGKSIVKISSLARSGEMQDIRQWQYNATRPHPWRTFKTVNESSSISTLFTDPSYTNLFWNVEGNLYLNPYFDMGSLRGIPDRQFLEMFGVQLHEGFWRNLDTSKLASRFKDHMMYNLNSYKLQAEYKLSQGWMGMKPEEVKAYSATNPIITEGFIKMNFLANPLQHFTERRTYPVGQGRTVDSRSLFLILADISRQNSIYSPYASGRSFTDGSGKTKWPYYEPSVITYRTQLLNGINDISEFDGNLEFSSINPNRAPWLRETMFYRAMFDGTTGKRRIVSGNVIDREGNALTEETNKIVIADLSSLETVSNGKYVTVHPKSLNANDKLFFDTVSLLKDGFIEIPRAATSSTVYAVKMNSYDAKRRGDTFVSQFLPIDIANASVTRNPRFLAIMQGYLAGELSKMRWYFDRNPELTTADGKRNTLAHDLNVFADIITGDLKNTIVSEVQALGAKDVNQQMKNIKDVIAAHSEEINAAIRTYFANYVQKLYNDKEGGISYMKLSPSQRSVLKNMLNVYENKTRVGSESESKREAEIASTFERREQTTAFAGAREIAAGGVDASMQSIAALFAVNQFILNIEYHNWYMGDNYLFSNPFKRGNLSTNTGTLAVVSGYTNEMLNNVRGESIHSLLTGKNEAKDYKVLTTHVIRDVKAKSKYLDNMVNDLLNFEKQFMGLSQSEVELRRVALSQGLKSYGEMTAADGQAKINLDSYRMLRITYGNWDWGTDEKEYQRQLAIVRLRRNLYNGKESQREKDLKEAQHAAYSQFNPQKFAYTGPELLFDSKGEQIHAPMRTKFDKMSLHPLIPEFLLGSGLPDEELMLQMAEGDIDYVKMASAAKGVAHDGIVDFYDNEGNYNKGTKLSSSRPEKLLSTYLKHQLNTDGMKNQNTFGSQQRVMFFDVKYLPEVQNNPTEFKRLNALEKEYLNSVSKIMDFQKTQFYNRFGLKETTINDVVRLEVEDEDRFAAAVNSIAKSNNFPTNMMEYLKYNPEVQAYTYDPSLMFNRKQLIDTIGGIIDKELRRLKTKGIAAIQVTSVGNSTTKYTNPTAEQLKEFGTNGLHYYHYTYDADGKIVGTSTMGIKITLQGDFNNLLQLEWNGEKIKTLERLNQALKDKAWKSTHMSKLTFLGYRIPTNNNNFIDHAEIMEFLPPSTGNIIIAPPEHIIKSGSDFDVDKMNFVFPSIDPNGKMASLPNKSIELIYHELNNRTNSIPDHKSLQKLIKRGIKKESKNFTYHTNVRKLLEERIRTQFIEIDPTFRMGDRTIYEAIEYFRPFMVSDEGLQKNVSFMEALDALLASVGIKNVEMDRDFMNLNNELTRYKDYWTNDMLEHMKETLRHPAYFKILITPSNTEYMGAQADRIGALTGRTTTDNLSSTANMTYQTMNAKHKEYLSDSKDLGLYSIQRRWFSLLNYTRMELNRDWKYGSKGHNMRINMPLAKPEQRNELGDEAIVRVHGTNLDGMMINDIWDQMMSLTIDLPSNTVYTKFGINKHNRKVSQYLTISRYSVPSIMSFINQPILQEVYEKFELETKNPLHKGLYTLKHAMIAIAKRRGIKGKGFDLNVSDNEPALYDTYFDIDTERDNEITTPNPYAKNPGIYASGMIDENWHFDLADMDNDIQNVDWKNSEFRTRQQQMLLYFMTVNLEASNFSGMQFTYSDDRNKNTSYFTIIENEEKKKQIRGNEDDDIPLDDSMFSKSALKRLEQASIYSPFNYTKVAKLFYEKFAKEFTTPEVAVAITKLLKHTNTFGIDRQLLSTRMEGDFVEFVYKNFGEYRDEVYDVFADELVDAGETFSKHFSRAIFNTNPRVEWKSYGEKLNKFKERYPELADISFVSKLYPEGIRATEEEGPGINAFDTYNAEVIRFRRSQDNTVSERNHYIKELESLVNFDPAEFRITRNYTPEDIRKISAFFTEMAHLTLYQAGPTNTADNFSDLIPNHIWQPFISRAFTNYHNAINSGKIAEIVAVKMFGMMYTENNPKVAWRADTTIYDLKWYDFGKLPDKKADRRIANQSRALTKYFRNFRAGKNYDMEVFQKSAKYSGISKLTC